MARSIWIDTTIKAAYRELIALVPDVDRPLLRRWMDGDTTAADDAAVQRILDALRTRAGQNDVQVRYRWVDSETGEVDD